MIGRVGRGIKKRNVQRIHEFFFTKLIFLASNKNKIVFLCLNGCVCVCVCWYVLYSILFCMFVRWCVHNFSLFLLLLQSGAVLCVVYTEEYKNSIDFIYFFLCVCTDTHRKAVSLYDSIFLTIEKKFCHIKKYYQFDLRCCMVSTSFNI